MGDRDDAGLGGRIETLRVAAGLSSRELDRLCGAPENYTRGLEVGRLNNPSIGKISAIASVFGVSLDWLCHGEGRRPTQRAVIDAVFAAKAEARQRAAG